VPLAKLAAKVMAGRTLKELGFTSEIWPHYWAVKESVFPFNRFHGQDILALARNAFDRRSHGHGSRSRHGLRQIPNGRHPWQPGAASRWWLHQSLLSLQADLGAVGSRLIIRRGPVKEAISDLLRETGARAVFWNRRYEPSARILEERLARDLQSSGHAGAGYSGGLLHDPAAVRNKSGGPFQVFTPFWRHCLALPDPPAPQAAPRALRAPAKWPDSLPLEQLELLPGHSWAESFHSCWQPGSNGAARRLDWLSAGGLGQYADSRDFPAQEGTSRLSAHLHFGEISPRQVWHQVKMATGPKALISSKFIAELGWREFSHHLLYHFPKMDSEPIRDEFARFRWRRDDRLLAAWKRGRTGFPLVDAGMRELWHTGWMHNRVRMVAASFLVKHLLTSWQDGAKWFWDTLVDADLAQNSMGWQWVAGCGADAAPFFRVFNPVLQGEKFDPQGRYVRRWVPELARLPDKWIHQPFKAPPDVLAQAGVEPGVNYPEPVINHLVAREIALEAYSRIRQGGSRSR
jgi:deoxyribodipyrimidine photo-lyase